jgi:cell division septation protein DedD
VKDQAESLGAKCPVSVAARARRDPSPLGILRAPPESVPPAAVLGTAPTAAARRRQRDSVLAAQAARAAARRDSAAKAAAVAAAAKPAVKPPAAVVATRAVDSVPVPRPAAPVAKAEMTPSPAPAGIRYAVQFAAYNDRPGADQFAETLRRRGIAARVEGTDKPFRVRAGRFTTREEAEATLQVWKKPGQQAIVVSYP